MTVPGTALSASNPSASNNPYVAKFSSDGAGVWLTPAPVSGTSAYGYSTRSVTLPDGTTFLAVRT